MSAQRWTLIKGAHCSLNMMWSQVKVESVKIFRQLPLCTEIRGVQVTCHRFLTLCEISGYYRLTTI